MATGNGLAARPGAQLAGYGAGEGRDRTCAGAARAGSPVRGDRAGGGSGDRGGAAGSSGQSSAARGVVCEGGSGGGCGPGTGRARSGHGTGLSREPEETVTYGLFSAVATPTSESAQP